MDPHARLLAERDELRERAARLRADLQAVMLAARDDNADDEHDPEGQTLAYERSQGQALLQQAEHHLAEIDAALERWGAGTFGRCERCGLVVPAARLEARPAARHCVGCASSG